MSTTRPFTGERSSRLVPLAADVYTSCRFLFGSFGGVDVISPRSASDASRVGTGAASCAEYDDSDDLASPGDNMARFVSCGFDAPHACRGLDTISEAARPNDPAVSKEADKTAVTGSHLFGSMMNGFGRNLYPLVSGRASRSAWKSLRCEHGWLQY